MRCSKCRKKIIIDYTCKCNINFCLNCLPFYNHDCTYDYKSDKQKELMKSNPKLIPIKINSI